MIDGETWPMAKNNEPDDVSSGLEAYDKMDDQTDETYMITDEPEQTDETDQAASDDEAARQREKEVISTLAAALVQCEQLAYMSICHTYYVYRIEQIEHINHMYITYSHD